MLIEMIESTLSHNRDVHRRYQVVEPMHVGVDHNESIGVVKIMARFSTNSLVDRQKSSAEFVGVCSSSGIRVVLRVFSLLLTEIFGDAAV